MLAGIGDVASIIAIVEFIPKLCKLVDNLRKHKKTKAEIRVKCGSLLEKLKDLDDKIGEINNMNPNPKLEDDLKKITSDLGNISTLFEERPAPSRRRKVEQLIKGPSTMQKLDEAMALLDSHISNIQLVIDIRAQMPKFSKSLPAIPGEIVGFSRVEKILDFLRETEVGVEVRVVAVCGEGGLGKTTLLKWTLHELWKQNKNNAFCVPYVEVGMHADDDKLKDLQSSIIEQLGGSQVKLQSWGHGHTEMVQQMEKMKRTNTQFCLAIDNVWERQHLSRLLPGNLGSCLPSSSYILLTTRSKEVVDELRLVCKKETPTSTSCAQSRCKFYDYDPLMLDENDAKELFRKHACLEEGKEQPLVDKMVERCQGLPLALEVWGKVFAKEEKRIRWKDIVKKVPKDVKDVLKLSYEELSPEAQKAFLDIVSFFQGSEWSIVSCIVGDDELDELESRSLLKPDYQQSFTYEEFCEDICNPIRGPSPIKRVKIHDLISEMGKDVAKSQGNRVIEMKDVAHNSELHKIEGIWQERWEYFHGYREEVGGDVLGKMQSLRILRSTVVFHDQCPPLATSLQCLDLDCKHGAWEMPIGKWTNMSLLSLRHLDWDFNRAQFPDGLRQLYLHDCHGVVELPSNSFGKLGMLEVLHLDYCRLLERLPTTMRKLKELRELVILEAPRFQELTPSVLTDLSKMRLLCLRGCRCLTDLPDVEWNLSNLTTLYLQECESLTATCVPISALTSLETLSLEQMHHLEISPSDLAELHVLKELSYGGCDNMSSLPETLGNLTLLERLDLRGCQSLTCLPETLGNLTLLERLDLRGCESLTCLPGSALGKLVQLKELTLAGCSSLARLPVEVGELKQLRVLRLDGCNNMMTEDVQLQILGGLESLQRLSLRDCHSVVTLPDWAVQSKTLEELNLSGCRELVRLPGSITNASSLRRLDLEGCVKLSELPEDMGNLKELRRLNLWNCEELQKLPESIGRISGLDVTILGCRGLVDLPQAVSGKLQRLEEVSGCSSLTQLPQQLWAEASAASSCSCNIDHVLEFLASKYGLTGLRKDVMTPSTLNSIREEAVPQLENLTLAWKHTGDEAMEEEWLGMLRKATSLTYLDISLDLGETGGNLVYKTVKAMLPILSLEGSHLRISGGRCELPVEVWTLPSLVTLSLKGTIKFNLPEMLTDRLAILALGEMSDLRVLPPQIKHLSNLVILQIISCAALVSLSPEIGLLKNLQYLGIQWCASLQELPSELGNLRSLYRLDLKGCTSLKSLPKTLCGLLCLEEVNLEECSGLSTEDRNLIEWHLRFLSKRPVK